jgi:hypothetical protein
MFYAGCAIAPAPSSQVSNVAPPFQQDRPKLESKKILQFVAPGPGQVPVALPTIVAARGNRHIWLDAQTIKVPPGMKLRAWNAMAWVTSDSYALVVNGACLAIDLMDENNVWTGYQIFLATQTSPNMPIALDTGYAVATTPTAGPIVELEGDMRLPGNTMTGFKGGQVGGFRLGATFDVNNTAGEAHHISGAAAMWLYDIY